MPLFREENFLIIHTGSRHTLFSFGLQDTLSPPQYKIPSVVFFDKTANVYHASKTGNCEEIWPVRGSRVVDVKAYQALLKFILQTIISRYPILTINQVPLLLIVPSISYSRSAIEQITRYVFETLEFTAFNVLDLSIASTFGLATMSSALVVNVGHESSQVMPVIGGTTIKHAGKRVNFGGKYITDELRKLLPQFSEAQITALKISDIYEVLTDQTESFYSIADLKEEKPNQGENFDVAKLVTEENQNGVGVSDEKADGEEESEEEKKPNNELEKNWFKDPISGNKVYVGKERFQGTDKLVEAICDGIYESLQAIPDLDKRQECYDNIILTGSTFHIKGLKEAVIIKLCERYLVRPQSSKKGPKGGENGVNSAIAAYQQTDEATEETKSAGPLQNPSSVRLAKHPEYFPEWKRPKEHGGSWLDVYFLGGEIYCKQVFGANSNHGGDSFIDTDIYEEKGPQAIWDVVLS
ncbi:hypothetical protein FT663_04923 [Candidozyma haemuli var. vulneris]|uniref:Actin-like protein ARP9 n=1 Tax=Candidozyma haemuli TaxID=45357 RepID=A0A2V1ARK2_9ASCO|nr:hypothetical protein CXQ85_002203 [[Candida] haemuloni]KAF3985688.1 hypothetical protein FT662_04998 [[Candida] haemuloni var. vulneris]KAF3986344.1 hypothetical protein FT663_04923 [[Candida] haemuloni var. vulneris]PVH20415.1 hypothetical protein CXQ85_002203 [[Candida] haemuloni]